MIGLTFLAAAVLWAFAVWWLSKRIPAWLGMQKRAAWLSWILFPVLLSLPIMDHIVGMKQFERLCAEQTGVWISPNAVNANRGKQEFKPREILSGYVIEIDRCETILLDIDTGETVARYNHFSTKGGKVGGLVIMGGRYSCSAWSKNHKDYPALVKLEIQIGLIKGQMK